MAKQPKKTPEKDKMPATATPARAGQKALGVFIDERLAARLKRFVDSTRPKPSKTSVVEAALEEYLDTHGAPPADAGED